LKRKIRKVLRDKYLLKEDKAQFAYFPAQKAKRCGDYAIIPTPPQFHKEIDEIVSMIRSFKPKLAPSQDSIKKLFGKGWRIDYKCSPEIGSWTFDAYKNDVAVEILGKNIDEIYKDCFKFLLAFKEGKIKFGIIIVPHKMYAHKRYDAISVDAILERFSPVLQDYGLWLMRASYIVAS
jgi:hypothetical protein